MRHLATNSRRCARLITVTLLFGAAVAGCGGGTKTIVQTVTKASGTTGGEQPTGGSSTPTTSESSTAAAGQAVAQATAKAPGTSNGTVDIAILGLRVHGQLMVLSVRFTPHFPDQSPSAKISLYDMSNSGLTMNQISLVDPIGLKRYLVVTDSNNTRWAPTR